MNKQYNYTDVLKQFIKQEPTKNYVGLFQMALMYFYGNKYKQDINKAIDIIIEIGDLYPEAYTFLGMEYINGDMIPVDINKGIELLNKAYEKNDPEAIIQLSGLYLNGVDVKRNIDYGLELLKTSVANGNDIGMLHLGVIYLGSPFVTPDQKIAYEYFLRADKIGNANASAFLGTMYASGLHVKQNTRTALQYFLKGTSGGSTIAHYFLGKFYYDGIHVKKNVEEAMNHFHHAADYGNLESIHQLIEIYSNSSTPEFNIDKSKFYLEPLLDNNDPYALYTAGRLTFDGIIYPHNTKEGLKYLRRAKIGSSYYLLGKTYQDGIHVNQDFSMALIYYFKGIEMGDVDCMINTVDLIINYKIDIDFLSILKIAYELGNPRAASLLGKCYLFGISVRKNRKKALALFTEAAANSDSLGYRYLGYCYIKGMGTEVDFTRGVYNYEIAAGLGDIEAALFLGTIANSADDQKNIDLAKQYFTLAANAGSSYGYYELALIYIDEDFDLSIEYLNKAINLGNDLAVKKYLEIKEK